MEIGNDVIVSTNVTFVTHDASINNVVTGSPSIWGKITVGDNCFIGRNSMLMYGVKLADNIIVAAGSVVTKSFTEERIIIGGNPARVIGYWDDFEKKCQGKGMQADTAKAVINTDDDRLITR